MQINISKTDYSSLLSLIDKVCMTVQAGNPSDREYNEARRLRLIKKKIIRINSKKKETS